MKLCPVAAVALIILLVCHAQPGGNRIAVVALAVVSSLVSGLVLLVGMVAP